MPFAIKASVDVKDLLASIEGLKKAVRTRVLKAAVTAGCRVIRKRAKAGAARESGLLAKSLGQKVTVDRRSGVVIGKVGPREGFRQDVTRSRGKWLPVTALSDPIKYAHLVEFGTKPHGKHPGAAAKPFLRPAISAGKAEVRAVMAEKIMTELAKVNSGGGA